MRFKIGDRVRFNGDNKGDEGTIVGAEHDPDTGWLYSVRFDYGGTVWVIEQFLSRVNDRTAQEG